MAKLKERVAEMAIAAGLIDRPAFEPQPADWAGLVEALDAGDMDAARTWAARFDVPLTVLPVLSLVRPLVAELEPLAVDEQKLWRDFQVAQETLNVLGRVSPTTVEEAERTALKKLEVCSTHARLRTAHIAAKQAGSDASGLRAGFSELFDGQPGHRMPSFTAQIYNAFKEAGFDPGLLYSMSWREATRREPAKRRPRFGLRSM